MNKWQCLTCGAVFELDKTKYVFGYCPECMSGVTRRIGFDWIQLSTSEQIKYRDALSTIAGPKAAYDLATQEELNRVLKPNAV